jgi:hypothetical protein
MRDLDTNEPKTEFNSGAYAFGIVLLVVGSGLLFDFDWRLCVGLICISWGRAVTKEQAKKYPKE